MNQSAGTESVMRGLAIGASVVLTLGMAPVPGETLHRSASEAYRIAARCVEVKAAERNAVKDESRLIRPLSRLADAYRLSAIEIAQRYASSPGQRMASEEFGEAASLYGRAVAIQKDAHVPETLETEQTLYNYATVLFRLDRFDEATGMCTYLKKMRAARGQTDDAEEVPLCASRIPVDGR